MQVLRYLMASRAGAFCDDVESLCWFNVIGLDPTENLQERSSRCAGVPRVGQHHLDSWNADGWHDQGLPRVAYRFRADVVFMKSVP
jgi:hypothetical protein